MFHRTSRPIGYGTAMGHAVTESEVQTGWGHPAGNQPIQPMNIHKHIINTIYMDIYPKGYQHHLDIIWI